MDKPIKEFSTAETFARLGLKPFLQFGKSGGGKTSIEVDLFLQCVDQQFSDVFYITGSYKMKDNEYLRNHILKTQVVQPKNETELITFLYEVTQDLINERPFDSAKLAEVAEDLLTSMQRGDIQIFKQ